MDASSKGKRFLGRNLLGLLGLSALLDKVAAESAWHAQAEKEKERGDSFHSCRLFPAPVAPIHLIQSHFPMRIGAVYNMHPICVSKVQSSGNRTWKTIDGGGLEQEERLWLPEKHGKIPILSRCHLRLSRSHDNVKWVDVDVNEDAAGDADVNVDVEGPT
uniref:HDC00804 n=1 Tax=Drosophila melanogaster TaxID=7227 RepID=Q6IHV2_DROME|nr:TPA_inf: HDC00804 [Drosophila melanogaster]